MQGPSGPGLDRDQTDIDSPWRFPVPVPKILSVTGLSGLRSGKNGLELDQTELPQHYCRAETLRCKADGVPPLIIAELGQDRPSRVSGGVVFESEACILVWEYEDQG